MASLEICDRQGCNGALNPLTQSSMSIRKAPGTGGLVPVNLCEPCTAEFNIWLGTAPSWAQAAAQVVPAGTVVLPPTLK